MANNMNILSPEMETILANNILKRVDKLLEVREKQPPGHELVTQSQAMELYEVSRTSLKRWERLGLRRYTPPIANSTNIYYKIKDIERFLGVEDG